MAEQQPSPPPPSSAEAPAATGPSADDEARGYTEKVWKGVPLYQCLSCHWNTTDQAKIVDHVENALENNQALGR